MGRFLVDSSPEPGSLALKAAIWAGDPERALATLEALGPRHPIRTYLKSYFIFDPLRSEPRFQAIYDTLRFPESMP